MMDVDETDNEDAGADAEDQEMASPQARRSSTTKEWSENASRRRPASTCTPPTGISGCKGGGGLVKWPGARAIGGSSLS